MNTLEQAKWGAVGCGSVLFGGPLLIGLLLMFQAVTLSNSGVRVPGTIVSVEVIQADEGQHSFRPTYAFHDDHGQEHTFTPNMGQSWHRAVGQRVTVLYPAGHPEQAAVDGKSLWVGPSLLLFFSSCWALAGLALARRVRSTAAQMQGVISHEFLRDDLLADGVRVDAIIIGVEAVGEQFVVVAQRDQIYRSPPLPGHLGDWLIGEPVEVWVDRQDPSSYVIDFGPVLERAAAERSGKA